ncbi:MAG: DUF2313 domain-containing protein [Pseudomonadota bacterium]|nr:DUF2313 domain-containing protein [Pseudomonadota bacterium]
MGAPVFSNADFLQALQALMPRGRVWPKESDAIQTQTLDGLAPTFTRLAQAAQNLLVDAFPKTTFELLPEWEETLGLPDPCAGVSPTLQMRQSQVLARFIGNGGQSVAYFVLYAKSLGYSITITNYTPFRMGQQRMGNQLGGPDWAFTWAIDSALNTLVSFRMGRSAMGEPLESWGNTVLECELSAIAPAHTLLKFNYS